MEAATRAGSPATAKTAATQNAGHIRTPSAQQRRKIRKEVSFRQEAIHRRDDCKTKQGSNRMDAQQQLESVNYAATIKKPKTT
jgi:hypothetical protein